MQRENAPFSIYFYQTHQKKEGNFVIENLGSILGIECKTSQTIRKKDVQGLIHFTEEEAARGIVFYAGQDIKVLTDKILVCPFNVLV